MSVENIVDIKIETKSLNMAQKGFGTPLILGQFDHPDDWKVRSFSDLSELLEWEEKPAKEDAKPTDEEASLTTNTKETREALRATVVFKAAKTLFCQDPRVHEVKIGRLKKGEKIEDNFAEICNEDEDFYGVIFPNDDSDSYTANAKTLAGLVAQKRMILGLDVENKSMATELKSKKNDRVFCIHSPNGEHLAAAWMGKMLTEQPGSSTWAYQQLKEVTPYHLSTSATKDLDDSNINRYVSIKGVGVTLDGKMCSGKYIDVRRSIDWLRVRMQERLFRILVLNKKIPYTLKGIDIIRAEILAQLKEGIFRGVLAEDPEPQVSTPAIEDVDESTRDNRILPKVFFKCRLAGAIHKIEINGTVTM